MVVVLAGVEPDNTQIEDAFNNKLKQIASPFISEKGLTKRIIEIYTGRDEYGREIID
jgi:hypothetical protein